MKGLFPVLGFLLLATTQASVVIVGTCYPCIDDECSCVEEDIQMLGARDEGNIWNPAQKGSNILPCGGEFSAPPTDESRLTIKEDEEFKLHLEIPLARGGGKVELTLKYGDDPNFFFGRGFVISTLDLSEDSEDESEYQIKTVVPEEYAYKAGGTLQVHFSAADGESFYQCVDLAVDSVRPLPDDVPATGLGDPAFDPDLPAPNVSARSTNLDTDDGWETFQIVVAILCVLLIILFCYIFYKYKLSNKEVPDEEADPIVAQKEQIQEPPVKPEPLQKELPPQFSEDEPEPPKSDAEPLTDIEAQKDDAGAVSSDADGSSGRHFHFRYVDDVDESDNKG